MNKQIFLSLALGALVSFSAVRAEDLPSTEASTPTTEASTPADATAPKEDQPAGEKVEDKTDAKSEAAAVTQYEKFRRFYKDHKKLVRGGTIAVVSAVALHKIMYIKCSWYRNWVDGTDEESETNKMPWARA